MNRIRAVRCHTISGDITTVTLDEMDLPDPGPGEVQVRLKACAVNFPDILMIQGKYQHKPPLPFSPGGEAAGDVAAVGAGVTGGFHQFADPQERRQVVVRVPDHALRGRGGGADVMFGAPVDDDLFVDLGLVVVVVVVVRVFGPGESRRGSQAAADTSNRAQRQHAPLARQSGRSRFSSSGTVPSPFVPGEGL